jgi:hypothetical protein
VRHFVRGSAANEQLTAIVAAALVPLLLAEGATLLNVRALLTVHAFIGMLLVPVVAVKLVSAGWRMMRYYAGSEEYVLRGPPQVLIRVLVAPVLVASTIVLFGTGIALLALDQTEGTVVGLHKASFVVWAFAFGVHFLTRLGLLWRALRARVPGISLRLVAASLSVVAGLAVATMTLPAMDRLQDNMSGPVGFDDR